MTKLKNVYTTTNLPHNAWVIDEDSKEYKTYRNSAKYRKKYAVYTQVDWDDGSIRYVKGIKRVNRTGMYALIPK